MPRSIGPVSEICKGSKYCPVVDGLPERAGRKEILFRVAGDGYIQVEYGTEQIFDLLDAFRLFSVMERIERKKIPGLLESGQGFRTLTVRYDPLVVSYKELIGHLKEVEDGIGDQRELSFKSKLVTLPIVFEDSVTREAIARYSKYIRGDAPNVVEGHNLRYAALYNGVSVEELERKFLQTEWLLVHQLFFPGGTYQLPIDPRSAIEAPKYNPVRTYTPEGTVGIGGQCVYIYTTESPGGYQMLGRTVPTYQLGQLHPAFKDRPFLLQSSDRIRYVETSEERLQEIYRAVHVEGSSAAYRYDIKEGVFKVSDWLEFVNRDDVREEVKRFDETKRAAQRKVPSP